MTDSERCLQVLSERDGVDGHYVTSCVTIAQTTGMPLRKVRETMKRLEAAGLVIRNQEGGCDGWTNRRWCVHGFSITKDGKKRAASNRRQ